MTTAQYSTIQQSRSLNILIIDWHIYFPANEHHYSNNMSTPSDLIDTFYLDVWLHLNSRDTAHFLTPHERSIPNHDIVDILINYNSPLILTINESLKLSLAQHINLPYQLQLPAIVHAEASITITDIINSHFIKPWMNLPMIPLLFRI